MIGDKSTLRRLEIQIPKDDQPAFLASTFDVDILREAIALKERGLTKRAGGLGYCTCINGGFRPLIRFGICVACGLPPSR